MIVGAGNAINQASAMFLIAAHRNSAPLATVALYNTAGQDVSPRHRQPIAVSQADGEHLHQAVSERPHYGRLRSGRTLVSLYVGIGHIGP